MPDHVCFTDVPSHALCGGNLEGNVHGEAPIMPSNSLVFRLDGRMGVEIVDIFRRFERLGIVLRHCGRVS